MPCFACSVPQVGRVVLCAALLNVIAGCNAGAPYPGRKAKVDVVCHCRSGAVDVALCQPRQEVRNDVSACSNRFLTVCPPDCPQIVFGDSDGNDDEVHLDDVLVDLGDLNGSLSQSGCLDGSALSCALAPLPCVHCGKQACVSCSGRLHEMAKEFTVETWLDYQDFYSCRNLTALGFGLGTAAIIANTSLDEDFQQWHDENWRNDRLADSFTWLGDGQIMIPVFAGAALIGSSPDNDGTPLGTIGEWGSRCSRSVLVGGPPMLAFKYFLNASRPADEFTSRWRPFDDPYDCSTVSGHAFIGAISFLNAAKMADEPALKVAFYTLSVMPGWARVNNRRHYLSQAMLGWWFAYLAANVADRTERFQQNYIITPFVTSDTVGMQTVCFF